VSRYITILPVVLLLAIRITAQQNPTPPAPGPTIPTDVARQPNPVKSTPESLARAKKWWGIDCAMCHGNNGDGKGDTAAEMKLKMLDFTDPATLKGRTDGELFYIIKNGYLDMPPEGGRVKLNENWDLVNYVRSLARSKSADSKPSESKN
jgi:cytochrome c